MTDSWDSLALWGPGEGAEVSSFMREHRIVGSTAHAGTCELTQAREKRVQRRLPDILFLQLIWD